MAAVETSVLQKARRSQRPAGNLQLHPPPLSEAVIIRAGGGGLHNLRVFVKSLLCSELPPGGEGVGNSRNCTQVVVRGATGA